MYQLIDPRNGEVFYIGKGQGRRMFHHVKEARRSPFFVSKKIARIQEILESGLEPIAEKIVIYSDEQAALDHEEMLIAITDTALNIKSKGMLQSDIFRNPTEITQKMKTDAAKILYKMRTFEEWIWATPIWILEICNKMEGTCWEFYLKFVRNLTDIIGLDIVINDGVVTIVEKSSGRTFA